VSVDPGLVSSGRIRTAPVERRPPSAELRAAGEVHASEGGEAEVGALVSGRVAAIEAREGAEVTRGQVLAWIEAPEAARATADVLRARARLAVADRKLARQELLQSQQATSQNALDDARAEEQTARAELLAARTLLTSLGGQEPAAGPEASTNAISARVPLRSPIAGVIARRDATLGGVVTPDRTLFRVVAGAGAIVFARVPETSHAPAIGEHPTIAARSGAGRCAGTVRGVSSEIDEATRTHAVRVEPDSSCAWLSPGGYVDVVFTGLAPPSEGPRIVIPREAVVDFKAVPAAFVQSGPDRPNEFVLRPLRLSAGDGPEAAVEVGLSEGERVVVAGALLLKGELLRTDLQGS
jgi:cobalt-zinc-cadmium efflux system membrane fusion protein